MQYKGSIAVVRNAGDELSKKLFVLRQMCFVNKDSIMHRIRRIFSLRATFEKKIQHRWENIFCPEINVVVKSTLFPQVMNIENLKAFN